MLFASNSVADQSLYGNDDFPVGIAGGEGDLSESVPGSPGQDYPIYSQVPETSFVCDGQVRGCSYIMSYRLGVRGISKSMTHYDRGGGKTNYDV